MPTKSFKSDAQKRAAIKGLDDSIKGHRAEIISVNSKLKGGAPAKGLLLKQLSGAKSNLRLEIKNRKEFIGMKVGKK